MASETLKAGRELDVAIARDVMGCYVRSRPSKVPGRTLYDLVIPGGVNRIDFIDNEKAPWLAAPKYSTKIEDAFAVLERMRGLGWRCTIETFMDCEPLVTFNHDDGDQSRQAENESGETIPECIALAALAALRQGKGNG
jgi:hypothetical protein